MKKIYAAFSFLMICAGQFFAQTHLPASICGYTLTLAGSPYIADSSIIINNGCYMKVDPGVEIRMADTAFLIIRGKADFLGTAAQPIRIHAQNSNWGIIYLDNTSPAQKSTFNYVSIEDAGIGPHGNTHADSAFQVAAISGNNSVAEINHCVFKNNLLCLYFFNCINTTVKNCRFDSSNVGEKIHGEMSDSVKVDSCTFYFTAGLGDVIDFDGSTNVTLSNNHIYGGDSDAFDIGNSDSTGCNGVNIFGNYVYGMGDKGISAGEHCSNIYAHHNVIVGCNFGISAKAMAQAVADHNTFYANRVGVRSCDCLAGWGPGNLTVTNCIIAASLDTTWVVDAASTLTISYSLSDIDLIPGTGNIQGSPMFVSPGLDSTANFHLTAGSAAIDNGDPAFMPDPDGTRSDIGAFYFNQATGISTSALKDPVLIYPNPAGSSVFVTLQGKNSDCFIRLSDVLGREVLSAGLAAEKNRVDISSLSPGIYYARILSGNATVHTKKLVVQ
ncbi:MAG: T9SS type A sorting domain-containing protein [Bacteroidia bacterium]